MTVYFPKNELRALGFIQIPKNCIPEIDNVLRVKIIIEDSQARRIATRYIAQFKYHGDVFAYLPQDQEVFVNLKVIRLGWDSKSITKEVVKRVSFIVSYKIGAYDLRGEERASSTSAKQDTITAYELTEVDFNFPVWNRSSSEPKIFEPMHVVCQEGIQGSEAKSVSDTYKKCIEQEKMQLP
ncbi:MAG TPA: hypothetical protein VFU89_04350 [Rhabdochlamydiaceae bacterium]|nr:hypothetical protein [Rhabdochlamydiaceae bacterium]